MTGKQIAFQRNIGITKRRRKYFFERIHNRIHRHYSINTIFPHTFHCLIGYIELSLQCSGRTWRSMVSHIFHIGSCTQSHIIAVTSFCIHIQTGNIKGIFTVIDNPDIASGLRHVIIFYDIITISFLYIANNSSSTFLFGRYFLSVTTATGFILITIPLVWAWCRSISYFNIIHAIYQVNLKPTAICTFIKSQQWRPLPPRHRIFLSMCCKYQQQKTERPDHSS